MEDGWGKERAEVYGSSGSLRRFASLAELPAEPFLWRNAWLKWHGFSALYPKVFCYVRIYCWYTGDHRHHPVYRVCGKEE
jgi:hypothetical protein